jgi:SH3-like domain-containing protein
LWARNFKGMLLLPFMLMLAACVQPRPQGAGDTYYLVTAVTSLRDAPSTKGYVVGQLYQTDPVEMLYSNEAGWWRVRSLRTNQTGWVGGELFSLNPVPVNFAYIKSDQVDLRECPTEDCPSLQSLSHGEPVQKIEENDQEWWRVLVPKSRRLGWLPPGAMSEKLEPAPEKQAATPTLYVAVKGLSLHLEPLTSSKVIKALLFNDQVEKLEDNSMGWVKVRQPSTGVEGWVVARYLGDCPLKYPRPVRPRIPVEPEAM